MCGIVGIIQKNQAPVSLEVLTNMANKIHHRGPDDEDYLIEGPVGFYHKRLSIIDLASGRQPMTSGDCTIIFNGEIYNYLELRDQLKMKGVQFSTTSDTEVILKMYQEYGEESIKLLNGMFAFLLYDRRRNIILAARDHFGIKPMYLFEDNEHLLFASEIKALLPHPAVTAEPDLHAIQEYITFQFLLGETTMFKNIRKVLPGHYWIIDLNSGKRNVYKYWEPNFKVDNYHTEDYFQHEFKRLLEDTVRIQLRSDVPLGAYLSGGTDSSLVSILASRYYDDQIKTFTGAFHEGKNFDETPYAKAVAEDIGADMHMIYPTAQDFIDLMPKLIYHLDEPVVGPGLFPQYMVSKLASQHVKVVLGGQGGDEIFGGYTRYLVAYLEQVLKSAIYETNEEGEHFVDLASIIPNLPHLRRYVPMMKQLWSKGLFDEMDRRYFSLVDRSEGALEIFSQDFRKSYDRERVFAKFQTLFNHPDTTSYFNKMTHFDMFGSLPGLLQVEDRVSMAVSLESRVPLLDRRIVDLVSTMPAGMKFKSGEMKYIMKRAAKSYLPEVIYNRKDKMGFPVPLHMWAKNEASDFIKDTLLGDTCKSRGIFNMEKLENLIINERAFGRSLWGVLSLELWFKTFIDS
ncbi:MAG: asparagine synthase (glutamine-hydrolyzing) [Bacteroidota bacterium]